MRTYAHNEGLICNIYSGALLKILCWTLEVFFCEPCDLNGSLSPEELNMEVAEGHCLGG